MHDLLGVLTLEQPTASIGAPGSTSFIDMNQNRLAYVQDYHEISNSTMFSLAYCAHFGHTFAAHWTVTTLAHSNSSVAVALRLDLTVDP